MLSFTTGNLFNSNATAIVNTVNCVGVMGKGLALQFKRRYPDNFKAYEQACKRGEVVPGKMFVFELSGLTSPRYIINFPTKRHWRNGSKLQDITSGLVDLKKVINDYKITSLAIPPLGAGLGGLGWDAVKGEIVSSLTNCEGAEIMVYEPVNTTKPTIKNIKPPNMTPGRAALIELALRYLNDFMDPFISVSEIHKLMYLLQEAGEPLWLNFEKTHSEPYAKNLQYVLNSMYGHLISEYTDPYAPENAIIVLPGIFECARECLSEYSETRERIKRVSSLIAGYESSEDLELIATVHWLIKYEDTHSVDDIIKKICEWSVYKKWFNQRTLGIAINKLMKERWIENIPTYELCEA